MLYLMPSATNSEASQDAFDEILIQPFSTIDQNDFMFLLGLPYRGVGEPAYLEFGWNWITSTILRTERKKHTLAGKKKLTNLEIYLKLPHDLILEIFSHLHPIDLYHLGQTSKAIRKIVLTNHAISLWKAAFRNDPDLPQCPPDLSEPRWTGLLFGPPICEECGRHGAMVDFVYRRRFCTDCMDDQYFETESLVGEGLLLQDNSVLELVPSTERVRGDRYWISTGVRYQREGVQSMVKTVEQFQADIRTGKPGAEEAFEIFKIRTKKRVAQLVQHHESCTRWASGIYEVMRYEDEENIKNIMDRIEARLVGRGHLARDIDYLGISSDVYNELAPNLRLTRRLWRHILPGLERRVNERKSHRLQYERNVLLDERTRVVKDIYNEYKSTLPPTTWAYLPSSGQIMLSEPFFSLINNPSTAPLDRASCDEGLSQLPTIISRLKDDLRNHLARSISAYSIDANGAPSPELEGQLPMFSNLDLATSVFTCDSCRVFSRQCGICLIGWDGCDTHSGCYGCPTAIFRFTPRLIGSQAVLAVMHLLDLDPQTTTPRVLDERDARLLCANCPVARFRGVTGHKAFTWRECAAHAIENEDDNRHAISRWQLLTPEAYRYVRMHEQPTAARDKSWSCTHCAAHLDGYVTRADAIAHVKETHFIEMPITNEDVFYYPGPDGQHRPCHPVVLQQAPLAEFACNRCPDLGTRLFAMRDLEPHLCDKHEIRDPVIDKDYVKIELIARVSPSDAGVTAI